MDIFYQIVLTFKRVALTLPTVSRTNKKPVQLARKTARRRNQFEKK